MPHGCMMSTSSIFRITVFSNHADKTRRRNFGRVLAVTGARVVVCFQFAVKQAADRSRDKKCPVYTFFSATVFSFPLRISPNCV